MSSTSETWPTRAPTDTVAKPCISHPTAARPSTPCARGRPTPAGAPRRAVTWHRTALSMPHVRLRRGLRNWSQAEPRPARPGGCPGQALCGGQRRPDGERLESERDAERRLDAKHRYIDVRTGHRARHLLRALALSDHVGAGLIEPGPHR